jgi:hypothetical protein
MINWKPLLKMSIRANRGRPAPVSSSAKRDRQAPVPTRITAILAVVGVLLVAVPAIHAADKAPAFPGLSTVNSDGSKGGPADQVHYPKAAATLIRKTLQSDEYAEPEYLVMRVYVDAAKKEQYEVYYSEGPSADPSYRLSKVGQAENSISFGGEDLYIPGNGAVYVTGIMNRMFLQRRKYALVNGRFQEVTQPLLYVGMASIAQRDLKITATANGGAEIATIAKGSAVEILLNQGDDYLLKTPFGLVGWLRITDIGLQDDVLKGLKFNGD